MSQENVELARRGVEHFMATGEQLWEQAHEDFEIPDHDILDAREYRGRTGYARWLEDCPGLSSASSRRNSSMLSRPRCAPRMDSTASMPSTAFHQRPACS